MNATIALSPTLSALYDSWYQSLNSCTTIQYCLLASVLFQEALSCYHVLTGADDENWDWDHSENDLKSGDDDAMNIMSEILASASSALSKPEIWDDLWSRVSRSRSVGHFFVQVGRSHLAEYMTGLSLNKMLKAFRGRPHRDVQRRRCGKLLEKVKSADIDSVTSSSTSEEFHSAASSSPPSSTDGGEESKE